MQVFLLASAITELFCAALCDALLDDEHTIRSQAILAYLDQQNLFLIPLDNERVWYRYHHLLRDLLIHKLRVEWGEARLVRLHQQASRWFAARDLSEAAVRHALWANQPDLAAQIILHQLRQPTTQTVGYRYCEPLLALIPEAVVQAQPALLVARAYVHYLRDALATLDRSVRLAAPRGFVRTFVDAGSEMAEMLDRVIHNHPHAAYIQQILAAFPDWVPVATLTSNVLHPLAPLAARVLNDPLLLTEREHEILHLLAARLSDSEIAERLIISVHTVKKHTSNIYGKLEVSNRCEAVALATSLGILTRT